MTAPAETLFSLALPNLQIAWDSTSLGLLKECPRKYKHVIIDGWQPQGFAAHLAFGIAYHKALETYDKVKFEGSSHDDAVRETVLFCLNYGTRDSENRFRPYDAEFTREPTKTRETLLRATIWYLEHFKTDPLTTVKRANGEPAVELSFKLSLDLHTPDGQPFLLCGHLDRLVELDDDYFFLDRKTTKGQITSYYWDQFTPNNQMSLYYTATQLVLSKPAKGGIIDAVQVGATFARFARHTIHRTTNQQTEWLADTSYWIGLAMQFAAENYWPMNDKACGNFGGCPFRIVCSRDPKVRDVILKSEGYLKRHWNPLENR